MDKSEIAKLPTGMSSEELDEMTTDESVEETAPAVDKSAEKLPGQVSSAGLDELLTAEPAETDDKLAQEALDVTDEESSPAGKSAETDKAEQEAGAETESEEELSETDKQLRAKDSKIAAMKHTTRELELENARKQGELDAINRQQATETTEEKSPLEIAMEAESVTDPDDLERPFAVMQAQVKWEKEQEAKKAETDSQKQENTTAIQAENDLMAGELSQETKGEGLDLRTVAGIGNQYLTRGDRLDIADVIKTRGSKAGLTEAYNVMVRRTLAAGNEDSKLLQNAINIQSKKSQAKPKPKDKTNIDTLTTEGEEKGEAGTEAQNSSLLSFLGEDGFMDG